MGHPSGAFRRHRIDTETAFGASLRVRANEAPRCKYRQIPRLPIARRALRRYLRGSPPKVVRRGNRVGHPTPARASQEVRRGTSGARTSNEGTEGLKR